MHGFQDDSKAQTVPFFHTAGQSHAFQILAGLSIGCTETGF